MRDGMVDRENIINGLQESAAYFRSSFDAMYGTYACEMFRNWTDAIEQAIALLKAQEALPAVDAVPVVHGRWEYFHCVGCGRYRCSECSHWVDAGLDRNYCPNCGAKMDGDT